MMPRMRWAAAQAIWLATLLLSLSAFVFGPWLLSMGLPAMAAAGGGAGVVVVAAVAMMRRGRLDLPAWTERPGTWLAILAGGALLRLAWGALMPVTLISDPRDYYDTAMHLLTEGRYYSTVNVAGPDGQPTGALVEMLAWRPPGLPFLFAGWFGVFGAGAWAIIGFNLVVYALSALVLGVVASRLIGPSSVASVLLAFAVWPKHIGYTGVPLTEGLSLLLLTLGVLLFDLALAGSRRSGLRRADLRHGSPGAPEPAAASGPVGGHGVDGCTLALAAGADRCRSGVDRFGGDRALDRSQHERAWPG